MKHQLEDAQRWNASLQARLGAIQNRGGGVGGAKDSGKKKWHEHFNTRLMQIPLWVNVEYFVGDTLSSIGDQTSYMSICVGEEHDESLSELSPQELRQKVSNTIKW